MTISTDFPVCPWCNCEANYAPDGIESTVCFECDKTFLIYCKMTDEVIKRHGKNTTIKRWNRNYETRKIME